MCRLWRNNIPQAILVSPPHSDSHHYSLLYDKEFMIKKLGNADGVKMSSIDKSENFYNYMDQAFHDYVLKFPDAGKAQFKSGWDMAQEYAEKFIGRHNQQVIEKISLLPQTTSLQQAGAGGGTPGLVNLRDVLLVLKAQELVEGTN